MKITVAAAVAAALVAGGALACPNYDARPAFGTIQLQAGFLPDPYRRNITAGGGYDLARCFDVDGWGGSVASAPDFRLVWSGSSAQLTLAVEAVKDTVLLVNDPNGQWFFQDDVYGVNPVITFSNPIPGQYDVWIGAYDGTSRNPGQLVITEMAY